MSISNYGELKTSVASWLNRTDLTAVVSDLVTLAESAIRRDVRCRAMEQLEADILDGEILARPSRHLETKRLIVGGVPLSFVTPEMYTSLQDANSSQAVFTNIGDNIYILGGSAGDAYTLNFYQSFPAFVADADTNWLLLNAPDIYLWASVCEGADFLKDDAAVMKYAGRYQVAVAKMREREIEAAFSGSPLQVRSIVSERPRGTGGATTSTDTDTLVTEAGQVITLE
jgi:hypothetical protein